jgi:signal peptidase I
LAIVVAAALRVFVLQPYSVTSTAMLPTLQLGDRILVVRPNPLTGSIQRGDVIVFRRPAHYACSAVEGAGQYLVKRVIALAGQTISSSRDAILVDGKALRERGWYDAEFGPVGATAVPPTTVPAEHYYVIGDNRADSCDSRSFGAISATSVVGKVVAIVFRANHPYFHWL